MVTPDITKTDSEVDRSNNRSRRRARNALIGHAVDGGPDYELTRLAREDRPSTDVCLSVVIPSFNTEKHLAATLQALNDQHTEFTYEIIVVDCSPTDAVREICASFPEVKFHYESDRFNPGRGRNIGANIAEGDLLLFVDADVNLSPGTLDATWAFYNEGYQVFGGALELNESTVTGAASRLEHYFFNHESHPTRPVSTRANLSSALLASDRSLFLEFGGFQDIPRMQDTELTERLASNGIPLLFNPAMVGQQSQDAPLHTVLRKIFITGKNLFYIRYQRLPAVKKVAMFLLLPLLALFKVGRIFCRHMRYQTSTQKMKTVLISPLLAIGGLSWMAGLYSSLMFGGGIGQARD